MMDMAAPSAAGGSYDNLNAAQQQQVLNPSEAAAFRLQLMRSGDLPDHQLRSITAKTLLLCSNKDRLFPSLEEGGRLVWLALSFWHPSAWWCLSAHATRWRLPLM